MISAEAVKAQATREQTSEENIVREYVQSLFLAYFYKQKGAEKMLFKGGTALRLIYGSPRYSEDLDYTASGIGREEADAIIWKTIKEMAFEGINLKVAEGKQTAGGFLYIIEGTAGEWDARIMINISMRKKPAAMQAVLATNPLTPPYAAYILNEDELIGEKINELLSRKKPRDYYDLYYILRKGVARKKIAGRKKELLAEIKKIDNKKISLELKNFLPQSSWPIIRNLKENLLRELERI